MRAKVQKEMMLTEKERKKQELRALAQKARSERTGSGPTVGAGLGSFAPDENMLHTDELMRPEYEPTEMKEEREERIQREKIREERHRERENERRWKLKMQSREKE
ncbi:putative SKI-interacting protein, SKIP [Helianthus annuus]|nr:putative SKI-interacting protein, SKIP [Helianthus annuus]